MKALNRINPHGIQYYLLELVGGQTEIRAGKKSIIVNVPIDVISLAWFEWMNGALVQDAFPFLDADEREFIKTAITKSEWDRMFGEN